MKKILVICAVLLMLMFAISACDSSKGGETKETTAPHVHSFGEWRTIKEPTCTEQGKEQRECFCGEKETQSVDALGHTEVIDAAVSPTCTESGLTEGKHCSVCEEVLVERKPVAVIDHEYLCGICSICAYIDEAYCQSIYNEMRAEMLCMDKYGVLESIKEKLDSLPSSYKDVEAIKEEFLFVKSQEQIISDAIINDALKWLLPEKASDYYIDYEKVRRAYLNLINNSNDYKNWDLIGLANNTIMGKNDEGYNSDFAFFVMVGEWEYKGWGILF